MDQGGPMDPTDLEHWYIYIILRRQKVIEKSQNSRNKVFSHCFCLTRKDLDPYLWLTDPDPRGSKSYGTPRIRIFLGLLAKPYQINVQQRSCANVNSPYRSENAELTQWAL
jgi:hypothetical protein